MAYDSSTGIITAPISIDDVKSALGVSSNDVGVLCTSEKINKWAKYKPVSYPKNFDITETEMKSVRCGITLNSLLRYDELFTQSNAWGYQPPTGGASSPYRLGDFKNYKSNATMPIGMTFPDVIKTNGKSGDNNVSVSFSVGLLNMTDTYCLHLDDILKDSEKDYYITAILKNGSSYYMQTAGNTIRQMLASGVYGAGAGFNIGNTPFYNLAEGTIIQAVCCLQPTKVENGTTSISNSPNMIPLEYESGSSIREIVVKKLNPIEGLTMTISCSGTGVNITSCAVTLSWTKDWVRSAVVVATEAQLTIVKMYSGTTNEKSVKDSLTFTLNEITNAVNTSGGGSLTKSVNMQPYTNWSQSGDHGSSIITCKATVVGDTSKSLTSSWTLKSW